MKTEIYLRFPCHSVLYKAAELCGLFVLLWTARLDLVWAKSICDRQQVRRATWRQSGMRLFLDKATEANFSIWQSDEEKKSCDCCCCRTLPAKMEVISEMYLLWIYVGCEQGVKKVRTFLFDYLLVYFTRFPRDVFYILQFGVSEWRDGWF